MQCELIKPLIGAMALTFFAGSQVLADSTVIEEISPEQSVQIKEYVVKHKVQPISVHEHVVVGSTLPEDVELSPVPSDWGPSLTTYRYVYTPDHVVLVEPKTRKIVRIIEEK